MTRDWIRKIADAERLRDDVQLRGNEAAARKADLVRLHGRRLLDELRATLGRDIDEFRLEFAGDRAREIVFEDVRPEGGFTVRKPQYPIASLDVAPDLSAASVTCRYRFTPTNGLPPREDRVEFRFTGDDADALRIRHVGTGQIFTNADALSEYLLGPVFTGRPR